MRVLNTAALIIGGILTLRRLVLMDRFHAARVILITAVLCGALLLFVMYCFAEPTCCVFLPA